MAVPKKRTTSASRGQRRAHDALTPAQLVRARNSQNPVPRRYKKAAERGILTNTRD